MDRLRLEVRPELQPRIEAEVEVVRQQALDRYRSLTLVRNGLRQLDHEFDKLRDWPENMVGDSMARDICMNLRSSSRGTEGLAADEQKAVIAAVKEPTDAFLRLEELVQSSDRGGLVSGIYGAPSDGVSKWPYDLWVDDVYPLHIEPDQGRYYRWRKGPQGWMLGESPLARPGT